ncbi:hypothetical protein [Microbispora sp. H11081]|uniref:hypothetical protein n=1 Tax=Microbispora sp. H11081 TaxID=2729107 RepID=UPI001B8BC4D5|nr:hypothetical protein [Microbispora sp. H11081]
MWPVELGRKESRLRFKDSFVSLLSDSGVPIEDISRLVGHRNIVVTETVYRKQIRPVLMQGAEKMDSLFEAKSLRPLSQDR